MDSAPQQAMQPVFTAFIKQILKHSDLGFAVAIIGIILVLLFPIPILLLDFLLAVSLATAILILMTCLFIDRPLDLSVFPTILLVTAVMRLALNIASTRLILAHGHTGTGAAGHIIEAFGSFVMESNVLIGAIVFIILTIINFVVITKGSGRIAEVAARFSLDAMPGKQMAIDADLSAGLIDEETAKTRRKDLEDESTFFGSMDGANKFVRGDAIAGLLITFINFVAGVIIGVVQRDLSFNEAIQTYTNLTIGDGLVSQIPALIISLSAGFLVSKSGVRGSTDKAIFRQLGKYPKALGISSALMLVMAAMPGLPLAPFVLLSAVLGILAWYAKALHEELLAPQMAESGAEHMLGLGPAGGASPGSVVAEKQAADEATKQSLVDTMLIESVRLELGYGLLALVNGHHSPKLTDQIKSLRKQIARDLGFVMPSVRIQDNLQLSNHGYVIRVKEIECGRGEVRPDKLLVMNPKGGDIPLEGETTTEPAFGLPAKWIDETLRQEASFQNMTVVDPSTVITTHLTEIVKENITELLSYGETQKLLDDIGEDHKRLVADTVPAMVSVSTLQRVLQMLLAEMISIRDLPTVLEALSEVAKSTSNITVLTEHVRGRLARQISYANADANGFIPIATLSPAWEQTFIEHLHGSDDHRQLSLPPTKLQEFVQVFRKIYDNFAVGGDIPVLLVSPTIRPYLRSIIERVRPSTVVLSQNEIHIKAKIRALGQIA